MKRTTLLFFVLILSMCEVMSQVPFGPVFPQDEVTTMRVTIDADSLAELILNQENVHEYPASFIFESAGLTDTVPLVGFRLRGNTSLNSIKKSFKISLNTFDSNGDLEGIEKLNLIGQTNDPSLIRSKLCHDAFRYFGVPCARTSFTKLFINDEYMGLYLNQEHIDEVMTSTHFDAQGDGNLYKCTYPATLDYISNNPDDYKFANWGTRHYELKTNEWKDDYSDLAHFIDVLNNTWINNLPCELPKVFHVENYIKTAALNVLTANWDGYEYNKNNFYLYHDQLTDQFNFIPYDLDNTLGIDWIGVDWTNRNIYGWPLSSESRPLFKKLMLIDEYRDRYSYYIDSICAGYFTTENIESLSANWQNLIASSVETDPYYPLDFGFTFSDFQNSVSSAWGGHVVHGISEYVQQRREIALQQLESYTAQDAFVHWLEIRLPADTIVLDALITGPEADNCILRKSMDGVSYDETPFYDTSGILQTADDHIYTEVNLDLPITSDKFYYQVLLPDGSYFPCQPKFQWMTPMTPGLFINEIMASNTATISDNFGEFDDWVELYNGTETPINLSGKFLSEDNVNWNKFPLPDSTIAPHDFMIIWLDDDTEQGSAHSNFKLGLGEDLHLVGWDENEPRLIQSVMDISSTDDVSWELTTDGGSEFDWTADATPGMSNNPVSVLEQYSCISIYPNPARDIVYFDKYYDQVSLLDASGRVIVTNIQSMALNLNSIDNGSYFLKLDHIIVPLIVLH